MNYRDWILHNEIIYRPVTEEEYTKAVKFFVEENARLEIDNKRLEIDNKILEIECITLKNELKKAGCDVDDNLFELERSVR